MLRWLVRAVSYRPSWRTTRRTTGGRRFLDGDRHRRRGLIAIATAFRALRREILEQRIELGKRIDAQSVEPAKRIDAQSVEISALSQKMHRLEVELRERMAKVENLLEGLREAISGKRAA